MVIKRIKAFLIDYLVIMLYAVLLLATTQLVAYFFELNLKALHPFVAELLGFFTLTLPVILYFSLMESAVTAGTIGKKITGIQVLEVRGSKAGLGQLIVRNCLKFLPWELAHFFIYQLFYFDANGWGTPGWILTGLYLSQALAVCYIISIIISKKRRSVYELLSGTVVESKSKPAL